jgi:small subunit ribosomal protein S34
MPPLLGQLVAKETGAPAPTIKLHYNLKRNNFYRLPKDGEKPNVEINMQLGKPASPNLYKGLQIE